MWPWGVSGAVISKSQQAGPRRQPAVYLRIVSRGVVYESGARSVRVAIVILG
jgi:hypothetical protein